VVVYCDGLMFGGLRGRVMSLCEIGWGSGCDLIGSHVVVNLRLFRVCDDSGYCNGLRLACIGLRVCFGLMVVRCGGWFWYYGPCGLRMG